MGLNIKQTTWDLSPLFSGDDDLEIEKKRKILEEEAYGFINKWRERDDYLDDPAILKEALDEYELWQRNYGASGDEGYYFWLRQSQDENSPEIKAKFNKIHEFSVKVQNDIHFFTMRLAKIPEDLQEKFLNYGGLKEYRHFLEMLFLEARHILSEPEEKILNLKSQTSHSNWVKMVSGFLSKEEREILTEEGKTEIKNFSEIISLIDSKNKSVRDIAAKALNDIFKNHIDSGEHELNSILQNKKTDDGLRGFSRPDAARHLNDDIESVVVDALISSVSKRFDIPKKYYELKAKLFGVPRLKYYERNVPYGNTDEKYEFEKAAELLLKTFKNLDEEFAEIFEKFLSLGQIDVYPKKGKRGGAFCAHDLLTQPTYILLNHTGKLHDVLTIAHEMGHGINNELMRKKQNALNFDTPLSTAEVASTFMEDFVLREILKSADDELRLSIMLAKLNDDISTIFRQTAAYKFEIDLHSEFRLKGYLPKEEIGRIFQKNMAAYMGEYVEQSEGAENWWVYWSHFRTFFYVYSYASGLLISKAMQNKFKENSAFMEHIKEFLSAGRSSTPKNIFLKMGINIADAEFWNKGLNEVEELLKETEELARKLKKI